MGRDSSSFHLACLPSSFQSTRPVWGATANVCRAALVNGISIHAPRVGRDRDFYAINFTFFYFNPRAPCGARQRQPRKARLPREFQSTRPVWGATRIYALISSLCSFQSTRPVWGATIRLLPAVTALSTFQSTRPVWGATNDIRSPDAPQVFQSTRPVWGATASPAVYSLPMVHFNPRAPCGARPKEKPTKRR